MQTFISNTTTKRTIQKSKFFCFGFQVKNISQVKEVLKTLHSKYPDATHICYAYILGNNQEEYYYCDDGEPSKTAGLPIYNAMKRNNISFGLIAIVRYFGGIKFGISALKNTFSDLANELINRSNLGNVKMVSVYKVVDKYNQIKNVESKFKRWIIKKSFNEQADFFIYCTEQNKKMLESFNGILVDDSYLLL